MNEWKRTSMNEGNKIKHEHKKHD